MSIVGKCILKMHFWEKWAKLCPPDVLCSVREEQKGRVTQCERQKYRDVVDIKPIILQNSNVFSHSVNSFDSDFVT